MKNIDAAKSCFFDFFCPSVCGADTLKESTWPNSKNLSLRRTGSWREGEEALIFRGTWDSEEGRKS